MLDPVNWLADHESANVVWAPVDRLGRVELAPVEEALSSGGIALCTVMWANNEVGTVQPVEELAQMCRSYGVPFHTDAVQVLGQLHMDVNELGATAVTISGHKIGGPFGVGALIVDPDVKPTPVLHGGGHEREIRSGTLDAAGISAFAVAVHDSVMNQAHFASRVRLLRNELVSTSTATPTCRAAVDFRRTHTSHSMAAREMRFCCSWMRPGWTAPLARRAPQAFPSPVTC